MTSARTVKTLAYLMAAMTAVTVVLHAVEPWTVLRSQPATARADEPGAGPPALASVAPAEWKRLELVLVAQEGSKPAAVPEGHLVVQSDGRMEATRLWRMGKSLPKGVLRVCAVYSGEPSDALLERWLDTCERAGAQVNVPTKTIQLSTTAQSGRDASQVKQLRDLHRRLRAMLGDRARQ